MRFTEREKQEVLPGARSLDFVARFEFQSLHDRVRQSNGKTVSPFRHAHGHLHHIH